MSNTIGHNGSTGWVISPRIQERAEKRSARQAALIEARSEAAAYLAEEA